MKEELGDRHRKLVPRWAALRREHKDAMSYPAIRRLSGAGKREHQIIWPELYSIILEMDMIALHFYGAKIGDIVRLIGKRYDGALAKIEYIEIASWYGERFTPVGEKPRIKVQSPKGRDLVLISGYLWELVTDN